MNRRKLLAALPLLALPAPAGAQALGAMPPGLSALPGAMCCPEPCIIVVRWWLTFTAAAR
jgi:hypothetical protein